MIRSRSISSSAAPASQSRLADVAAADQAHREQRVDAHRVVERHARRASGRRSGSPCWIDLREPAGAVGAVRARHALRAARSCPRCRASGSRPRRGIERAGVRLAGRAAPRRPRGRAAAPESSRQYVEVGGRRARRERDEGRRRATGTPSRGAPCRAGERTTAASRSPRPSSRPPATRATRSRSSAYVSRVSPRRPPPRRDSAPPRRGGSPPGSPERV